MKILDEFILGGKKIQNVILNYEELKSIKRHPDNRPDGTEDEYSKFYSESAKKKIEAAGGKCQTCGGCNDTNQEK